MNTRTKFRIVTLIHGKFAGESCVYNAVTAPTRGYYTTSVKTSRSLWKKEKEKKTKYLAQSAQKRQRRERSGASERERVRDVRCGGGAFLSRVKPVRNRRVIYTRTLNPGAPPQQSVRATLLLIYATDNKGRKHFSLLATSFCVTPTTLLAPFFFHDEGRGRFSPPMLSRRGGRLEQRGTVLVLKFILLGRISFANCVTYYAARWRIIAWRLAVNGIASELFRPCTSGAEAWKKVNGRKVNLALQRRLLDICARISSCRLSVCPQNLLYSLLHPLAIANWKVHGIRRASDEATLFSCVPSLWISLLILPFDGNKRKKR